MRFSKRGLGICAEVGRMRNWKALPCAVLLAALASPGAAGATPAQDSVMGVGSVATAVGTLGFDFTVTSGPSGENPGGQFALTSDFLGGRVDAAVACLRVFSAAQAVIGINVSRFSQSAVVYITDEPDSFRLGEVFNDRILGASDCPTQFSALPSPVTSGAIEITDAPALPTSKEQCKQGGWRNYGDAFKNQGQCVAFVQRGPKP